jgi:lipoprotein-anchoring transpeptidase ErfK/SrfK
MSGNGGINRRTACLGLFATVLTSGTAKAAFKSDFGGAYAGPDVIDFATPEQPGTLIVNTGECTLYQVLGSGLAMRFGVAVGKEGHDWAGIALVGRKAEWPVWTPPASMISRRPELARWSQGMPGGPDNPLGARALYLYANGKDTLFRIHGTNEPRSIGKAASSGCIRMLNADIVDLYDLTPIGTKVIVL